jgi:Skp family chaperone for outer membrane proteins
MKKYFTILTLVFSILSNASIAQDSTASRASGYQKNSRFAEKLRENKEKRQQRLDEIQQKSEKRREEAKEKMEERRSDRSEKREERVNERREERRNDQMQNDDKRESSRMENRVAKMPEINQGQQPSNPRESNRENRR